MPVVGFSIKSIEGKRSSAPVKGEIQVNSTPKITDVTEASMPLLEKAGVNLSFEFETTYSPDIASIRMVGDVVFLADNKAQIMKQWKKDKKLPDALGAEVLNYLFRRCLLRIAVLADDLQLPPPISMPLVKPKEKE